MPKLERSYFNHFYQENDSHSKKCYDDFFLDRQGRLWLVPCGDQRLINSIGLFRFDGYSFQPVEVVSPRGTVIEAPRVLGIDEQGRFLGTNEEWQLFRMDPDSHESRIISPVDSSFRGLQVVSISNTDKEAFILGRSANSKLALFRLKEGGLVLEPSAYYPEAVERQIPYAMTATPESIWFSAFSLPLCRFDRQKETMRIYDAQDFVGLKKKPSDGRSTDSFIALPKLLKSPKGKIYLFPSVIYERQLFEFDRERDAFWPMADQFPADWLPINIFQDSAGNICFLFQDAAGTYRAVLETVDGQRFDYSAMVAGQRDIRRLAGRDFRRQAFLLTGTGLYCAGIREQGLIRQTLTDHWVSSMAGLPDARLLINTIDNGWFVYDKVTGKTTPFQGPDCGTERPAFGQGMKQQIIPDDQGNLWFISRKYLVKYDPATNDCQAFDFGKLGSLFAMAREGLAVFQYDRDNISMVDIRTQQPVSFGPGVQEHFDGFVRDILVDHQGLIWIPTNDGLWRIDLDRGESEVLGLEHGFTDFRFTSIFEDAEGRLWLGTYLGGLQIYDPRTGAVTIIDQGQGLSNNTIMSIIADDEGDIWVGTEYGINLISKEGEVLNSIHEEDGLAYEIFERFDPFKDSDGLLYFGSRKGISIIDPTALKASMNKDTTVRIYLTELGYFDKEKGADVVQKSHFKQIGRLEISPERPYLRLKFALSSYLEPHNNRYAYKIEGKDEDWHYLGAQPELNISRLPPGKYRLLIKGADFRNNWIVAPLAIDIHAREFFYKQPWFYLLAALPFITFGLIWARNKQQEARRLEREVARRTQKIREDKAVIEQQAMELRQLDSMKSRFFTNISHELRTPITLIKAPLENLIQKHGASLDERIGRSLRMILNNAGKLGRLVEELLELSSLEAKKATLKETATPLSLFCRQLFGAYESGAALKNVDYCFHSGLDEEAHFLVDRRRLEKIVNNLLSNALKFTPDGGTIRMSLRREAEHLLIEVEDSGRGIPPEDMPHLFDRYFQTRRDDIATEGGTGIGLALSRELALLMQGNLTVESKWGAGACFSLQFPAKEAAAVETTTIFPQYPGTAVQEERPVLTPPVSSAGDAPKTKVLIVEDNPDMQQLLHTLLADQYDCVLANNGAEAWAWLQEEKEDIDDIELILSDVMMPEMDGYTLLEKIKAHQRWQKLPAVMLTARSAEEDKLQALRMGVDDYLLKPFSPAELEARLQNLVANYRARKDVAVRMEEPDGSGGIGIAFKPEESAHTVWLKEVEDAAREALDKGLKLSTALLADRVFLSERQFSRKLKMVTGLTPNGYILEVKLQKARHLLEHQVYTTVNEVAQAAGYSSGSYLTKVYQERFGKKPGDYF
ncbi:MAG: response regulator [Lewinellaceae bacterium]|nr:response regulator [Lewinellaceae bacterium]